GGSSVSAQDEATSMQSYAQNPFLATNVISVGSLPGIFGTGAAYIGTAMASLGAGFDVLTSATESTANALHGSGLHEAVVTTTTALDAGLPALQALATAAQSAAGAAEGWTTTTTNALGTFFGAGPALNELGQ